MSEQRELSILPPVEIKNIQNDYIIVEKVDGVLLVYNSSKEVLYQYATERYPYLYLSHLKGVSVSIRCKILKVMLDRCSEAKISFHQTVIGTAEFFKCTNVNIKVKVDEHITPIPIVRIENCDEVDVYQSSSSGIYLIKQSIDICCYMVGGEEMKKYEMGKLIWGNQEQTLICISEMDGKASIPMTINLNEMQHHIFSIEPSTETLPSEDIFGTSPPSSFFF